MLCGNAERARRRATGRDLGPRRPRPEPEPLPVYGIARWPADCSRQLLTGEGWPGYMQPCAIPVGIGHLVLIPGRQVATAPGQPRLPGALTGARTRFLITTECQVLSANAQNNKSGCAALGHGTLAPARQGREPGARSRQSGPRASCQNTMSSGCGCAGQLVVRRVGPAFREEPIMVGRAVRRIAGARSCFATPSVSVLPEMCALTSGIASWARSVVSRPRICSLRAGWDRCSPTRVRGQCGRAGRWRSPHRRRERCCRQPVQAGEPANAAADGVTGDPR